MLGQGPTYVFNYFLDLRRLGLWLNIEAWLDSLAFVGPRPNLLPNLGSYFLSSLTSSNSASTTPSFASEVSGASFVFSEPACSAALFLHKHVLPFYLRHLIKP